MPNPTDQPICPMGGVCDNTYACAKRCKDWVGPTPLDIVLGKAAKPALHFVGFKDTDSYNRAARIWGDPDFIHRTWDVRAQGEIVPGDVAVFHRYSPDDPPKVHAWDASARADDPATWERT